MYTLIRRWMLLLSGLFLLPVLLIRAQPYDDTGLRELLTPPPDCPAPCFMGIRPDVTTPEEALAMLQRHPWVAPGGCCEMPGNALYEPMRWEWADAAPAWLDRHQRPEIYWFDSAEIGMVSVATTIPWSQFVLAFGWPDGYRLLSRQDTPDAAYDYRHLARYVAPGIWAIVEGECTAESGTLYDWPVTLRFQRQFQASSANAITASDAQRPVTRCR